MKPLSMGLRGKKWPLSNEGLGCRMKNEESDEDKSEDGSYATFPLSSGATESRSPRTFNTPTTVARVGFPSASSA